MIQNNIFEAFQAIGSRNKKIWFLFSLFFAIFIGLTDYLTGAELSFSIFYLIPVSMATLFSGRTAGISTSLLCAAIWLSADLSGGSHYSHNFIPYWNAIVRLGYFAVHTILLSYLLRLIQEQKLKALSDPLTGTTNWRYFEEFAKIEFEREKRSKKPLTIVYLDIDNFKQVNDTMGHDVGDIVLKSLAEIIQSQLRPSDIFSRLGGDEFILLLSETGFEEAQSVLNRIKEAVNHEIANNQWPISLSIGPFPLQPYLPPLIPWSKKLTN